MRRVAATVALVAAVLLLSAAIAWKPLVEPALVRFPTNTDETIKYEGTFDVYVDPATGAALAAPVTMPLEVDRRIHVVDSTFDDVVVREDITMRVGDLPASTDRISMRMDRRTMQHVPGEGNWAYDPENSVDRTGTYRINFPMGARNDTTYRFWAHETGSVSLVDGPVTEAEQDGLDVFRFHGGTDAPVIDAYRDGLIDKGFPDALSPAALRPQLAALGIDLDALAAALLPVLTPEEAAVATKAISEPVRLDYEYYARDLVSVEPKTGGIVKAVSTEGVRAKPDLTGVDALRPILLAHADVPAATGALAGLDRLAAQPAQQVFEATFAQTPASTAETADYIRSQLRMMRIVELWAPVAMFLVGLVVFAVALRLRRGGLPVGVEVPVEQLPPPKPKPAGGLAAGAGH